MVLRLATWNICFGTDLPTILSTIRSHKEFKHIDILALQEASIHSGTEDAKIIAKCLGKTYDYFQVTAQKTRALIQANALIWNSKKIIVDRTDTILLPTYIESSVSTWERSLKRIIKKEKRGAVILTGRYGTKKIRIYSAHLDVVGFGLKTAQLRHLFNDNMRKDPVDFCCISGDLNTFKLIKRPIWKSLQQTIHEYNFIDITTDIKWTFQHKQLHFRQKTDAIFLQTKGFLSYTSQSLPLVGSDHIPIFANIKL